VALSLALESQRVEEVSAAEEDKSSVASREEEVQAAEDNSSLVLAFVEEEKCKTDFVDGNAFSSMAPEAEVAPLVADSEVAPLVADSEAEVALSLALDSQRVEAVSAAEEEDKSSVASGEEDVASREEEVQAAEDSSSLVLAFVEEEKCKTDFVGGNAFSSMAPGLVDSAQREAS
jgi:hypothetical protein